MQPIRGTQDIFGEDFDRFRYVIDIFNTTYELFGFQGASLPVIEKTELFARLGESSDIVSKEMYTFSDRNDESISLRPEFTAGIARAYLSSGWQQYSPIKVATSGPLFRYDSPQKGRYRQFNQIDAEIIGSKSAQADVELLVMSNQILESLGVLDKTILNLNTLGDGESRAAWRKSLVEYFNDFQKELSPESKVRLIKNPLRILDSKSEEDAIIVQNSPTIDDYLTERSKEFFSEMIDGLEKYGIKWERDARLVRGMDYYSDTAFEYVTDCLGAQGTVLGGGRYDGLISSIGGNDTPAVGWAAGVERLAMLLDKVPQKNPVVSVIEEGGNAVSIISALRRNGISVNNSYGSVKKQVEKAKKSGVSAVIFVKPDDVKITKYDDRISEELLMNIVRGAV